MLAEFIENAVTNIQDIIPMAIMPELDYTHVSDEETLAEGDSALFAAGVLYAITGQVLDKQDYLLDCSVQVADLDSALISAWDDYDQDNFDAANETMYNAFDSWGVSMEACDETNRYFDALESNVEWFIGQDNWEDIAQENYTGQEALIDQQWAYFKKVVGEGQFFNAGMFYARCYILLTGGSLMNNVIQF